MRISCRSTCRRRASSRRCSRRRRARRCRCRRSTCRGRDDPAGRRSPRSRPAAASRRSCSARGRVVADVRSGNEAASPDSPALERAVAILAGPATERFPLRGSVGRITLVVGAGERGVLALDGLGRAPDGRIYAAWLVPPGSATPVRVATFSGDEPGGAALAPGRVAARASASRSRPRRAPDRPSRSLAARRRPRS